MTVYADVLVIVNLYVDFFLLWATRRVLQLRAKPWRLAAGALVGGLCAFLEISRSTWHEYCQEEKFRETTEWAREQMLSWREEQLLRRPGKMLKGLTLDLQANYGYARRLAVGKGDQGQVGADSGPSAAGMTTAEKMALLREMAGVIGNGEDPG